MANAWIIPPLPIAGWTVFASAAVGAAEYLANDYAGVTLQMAVGYGGANRAVLRFDLGADQVVDTLAMFGLTGLPDDAQVQLSYCSAAQGNFTGAVTYPAGQPVYAGSVRPPSGGVMLYALPSPVIARYLQLDFMTATAGHVMRAARLVVGRRVVLERNFGFGATFGVRDLGSLDFSRRGVLQRARGRKLRTVGLTFSNVQKDEVEAQTRPLLERIGNTEMVCLVTDPAPHAQRQNRCYFGPLVGDLAQTWRKANLFEAKTNLVSIF